MSKSGNDKRPTVVRVQTQARAGEILSLCDEHGWKVIVGIEPDKPEDISDVERPLNPPTPDKVRPKVGRNDPCPFRMKIKFIELNLSLC